MSVGLSTGEKPGARGDGGGEKRLKLRDGGMGDKGADVVSWSKRLDAGGKYFQEARILGTVHEEEFDTDAILSGLSFALAVLNLVEICDLQIGYKLSQ